MGSLKMRCLKMRSLNISQRFSAVLAAVALLVASSPGWAALTANSIVTTQNPKAYKAQITSASGTTAVSLITPGANGTKVISIICSNTDTAGYNVTFSVLRSAATYALGTVAIAASAGNLPVTPPASVL